MSSLPGTSIETCFYAPPPPHFNHYWELIRVHIIFIFSRRSDLLGRNGLLFYIFQYHGLRKDYLQNQKNHDGLFWPRPNPHCFIVYRVAANASAVLNQLKCSRRCSFVKKDNIIVGTVHINVNEPTWIGHVNWFLHCVFKLSYGVSKLSKMVICPIQHVALTE